MGVTDSTSSADKLRAHVQAADERAVEWDDEGDPIWSDEDMATWRTLKVAAEEEAHRARMRSLSMSFSSALAHLTDACEAMRRQTVEARANTSWHYSGAKLDDTKPAGSLAAYDDMMIRRATLDAQQFGATYSLDRLYQMRLQRAEQEVVEDAVRHQLHHQLTGHVYGHRHPDVETTVTREVAVDVPDGWWQTFRRDVLKKPCRMKQVTKLVRLSVSARRFSAFPELPYEAPKNWGPRIDLVLPQKPNYRVMLDGR